MATTKRGEQWPIAADERSGVLQPSNLVRYGARWFAPGAAIVDVVDHYWHVAWNLEPEEAIDQVIITAPAVTLSIEHGDVPGRYVVTGVHRRAWSRRITGRGEVFAIRLRPAGLKVCSDLTPEAIANSTIPITPDVDARAHELLADVASAGDPHVASVGAPDVLVARYDRRIADLLAERPLDRQQRIANEVVEAITGGNTTYGVGERTAQRALKQTLGQGPKWVSRWVRLQEVARRLSIEPDVDAAAIAADLGYVDQSHLVNDFRAAVGTTPGAYVRGLRTLAGDLS